MKKHSVFVCIIKIVKGCDGGARYQTIEQKVPNIGSFLIWIDV